MKNKILTILLVLCSLMVQAQQKDNFENYHKRLMKDSKLIVEGHCISIKRIKDGVYDQHEVNKILVKKVLKGDQKIVGDTIILFSTDVEVSHRVRLSRSGIDYIFFCKEIEDSSANVLAKTYGSLGRLFEHPIALDPTNEQYLVGGYGFSHYKSRAELYNYLKQFRELTIKPDMPQRKATVEKSLAFIEKERQDSILFEQDRAKRGEEWMYQQMRGIRLSDSLKAVQKKSSTRSAKGDQIMAGGNLLYLL